MYVNFVTLSVTVHLFFSRRRSANSFGSSPDNNDAPSGVCAEVRVPSTALHIFVSITVSIVLLGDSSFKNGSQVNVLL